MIRQKTVFIIGAGASAPFGFPTGNKLVDDVNRLISSRDEQQTISNVTGCRRSLVEDFRLALVNSEKTSVDAFLEHRPEYLEIGRAAIARALIPHENKNVLFDPSRYEWPRYLFNKMNAPFDKFEENQVSFITFNYDRLLDHFLFCAVSNTYGKNPEETAEQISPIPIIHLHGSLGDLLWQNPAGRDYDNVLSDRTLKIAAEKIKIIHEDIADRDKDFSRAKELLTSAKKIYFFGFGYDLTNMKRLDLNHASSSSMVGSGHGLTQREANDIGQWSGNRIAIRVGRGCLDFLRNDVDWS